MLKVEKFSKGDKKMYTDWIVCLMLQNDTDMQDNKKANAKIKSDDARYVY